MHFKKEKYVISTHPANPEMVEFGQMDTRIQLMNCHSSAEVTCHECLAAYHSAFQGGSAGIQT